MMSRVQIVKKDSQVESYTMELRGDIDYFNTNEVTINGWRFYAHHNPPKVDEEINWLKKIIDRLLEGKS